MEQQTVFRILDANHNRVAEGLRVVEEYLRFQLNDQHLSGLLKQLRHDLQTTLQKLAGANLVIGRDTLGDVGQEVKAGDEHARGSLTELLAANWQRVQQGLRVLEEYAKLLPGDASQQLERLRYRAYTLAKATHIASDAQQRLADAQLYVLLTTGESTTAFTALVKDLVAAEVDVIQLRDKQASDRLLLERAHQLRELTRGTHTLFIMNDRADIAALTAADGVHVGQDELTVAQVRQIVGPQPLVGVSTHDIQQARQAVLDGANYIGCGPTFPSQTKTFGEFPGPAFLQQVADEISLPAFAIGGIDHDNLPQVLASGCRRIAVSAVVTQAAQPKEAAKELKVRLQTAKLS